VWPSLVFWLLAYALYRLDGTFHVPTRQAAIFSIILSAIGWLADVMGSVGGTIAASLEGVVLWLVHGLGWLSLHVADIFKNTGAMFSKVWEGAKIVYDDVVKPFAQWLHDTYESIKGWMTRVFGPILQWANKVRDTLMGLYKNYLRPVFDALDTTRKVLAMLAALHIPFAQALENVVSDIEQTLQHNFLLLLGWVNKVIDTLNGLLTLDGLLQRYVFLRTLERDAFYVWRVSMNSKTTTPSDADGYRVFRALEYPTIDVAVDETLLWLDGQTSPSGEALDAGLATWNDLFGPGDPSATA
jgi:hypothetical protein